MVIGNPYHASHGRWVGGTLSKCPRCGQRYNSESVVSRVDGKTRICPVCAKKEEDEGYLKINHEGYDETRPSAS